MVGLSGNFETQPGAGLRKAHRSGDSAAAIVYARRPRLSCLRLCSGGKREMKSRSGPLVRALPSPRQARTFGSDGDDGIIAYQSVELLGYADLDPEYWRTGCSLNRSS